MPWPKKQAVLIQFCCNAAEAGEKTFGAETSRERLCGAPAGAHAVSVGMRTDWHAEVCSNEVRKKPQGFARLERSGKRVTLRASPPAGRLGIRRRDPAYFNGEFIA
ncbi:hypothetical protein [Paraburkholderia heleia]|uniref:hypothetical protein n=1 Tax=Paraburkholderia heleia TaxID=634127 RepID=UPI0031D2E849